MGYLAIDPGGISGYAYFDDEGNVMDWGQIDAALDGIVDFMTVTQHKIDVIICEDYRVRGDPQGLKANVGGRVVTIQIIGFLKGWAKGREIEFVLQDPSVRKIGEKYSGYVWNGAHKESHRYDAYNHGYYYLVRHRVKKPKGVGGRTLI